jgi:MGT family glycosyltransferase
MPAEEGKLHFGVLSFTGTGHVNPLISLSHELVRRGHRVTFFDQPKIESRVREAGLGFVPVGTRALAVKRTPPSSHSGLWSEIATLHYNLERIRRDLQGFLEETPAALTRAGVNALLIDEIALTGPTVAQILRLPYFIISTSVPHRFGWKGSSWLTGHRYSASRFSWMQSAFLELSVLRMRGPIRGALDEFRRKAGLESVRTIPTEFPCLAHITQMPECLDLPRRSLPKDFHYTGPFVYHAARPHVAFPWRRLDGRPILFASLGTTRNVQPAVFRMIAEASEALDVQLVISLGNRFDPDLLTGLPGRPVVLRYVPQLELMKLAQIVITHGGSNTVFEALMEGKPMIVIPLAYDQPAMAARLARLRVAEVLPVMRLSPSRIRAAVSKLLGETSYSDAARAIQTAIRSIPGPECAADIIETAFDEYLARQAVESRAVQPEANCASAPHNAQTVSCLPR